jgi:hypothetical protein
MKNLSDYVYKCLAISFSLLAFSIAGIPHVPQITAIASAQESNAARTSSDFLVNDDTSGGCAQLDPDVAINSSGEAIAVWIDGRHVDRAIYAQRFDATHNPIGSGFRVTELIGKQSIHTSSAPCVAISETGSFVVAWGEWRESYPQVYARLYNREGKAVGPSFQVSTNKQSTLRYISVAMDADGDFAICWPQRETPDYRIFLRIFESSGEPLGPPFSIFSKFVQGDPQPRVASDADGNITVVWGGGSSIIYACSLDPTGTPLSDPYAVNRPYPNIKVTDPKISMASDGRHAVTWTGEDTDRSVFNAYVRTVNSDGLPVSHNVLVSKAPAGDRRVRPDVAMCESGSFAVTWRDDQAGKWQVYMQEFNSLGDPVGSNVKVNDVEGTESLWDPAIAGTANNEFLVVWGDDRHVTYDVFGQLSTADPVEGGTDFQINDDVGTSTQYIPDMSGSESGQFVIAWTDRRDGFRNCYAQRYDHMGNPIGANFRVNDSDMSDSWGSAVASDGDGNFAIVWRDYRHVGRMDIYAQRYDSDGNPIDNNFMVNDVPAEYRTVYAFVEIDMNDSGEFVVVWNDMRGGTIDVFGQKYGATGEAIGSNFLVNKSVWGSQRDPSVAIDDNGDFVVTWFNDQSGNQGIYFQMYDSAGTPSGSNRQVTTPGIAPGPGAPTVSADASGGFVIAFSGRESGISNIYAQRFDPDGDPLDGNILVVDDPDAGDQYSQQIACGDLGDFAVTWHDQRNGGRNVYAQVFDAGGNPQGSNQILTDNLPSFLTQEWPTVAVSSSAVFYAWQDSRRAKAYDIYAKVGNWPSPPAICGDVDGSGTVDVEDVVHLLDSIFAGDPDLRSGAEADVDGSGNVDIDDAVCLVNYIFFGGDAPCGTDSGV